MNIEIVDNDRHRAEAILLLLSRTPEVADEWRYLELAHEGRIYAGWVRLSEEGLAEGHTLSVRDVRH
jgi:hypothetical protein